MPGPPSGSGSGTGPGVPSAAEVSARHFDAWWKRAVDAGCEVTVPLEVAPFVD